MLKEQDKAPDFTLNNQDGNPISLHDFAGKKVILYFYPRDNTPGCTREACAFRDQFQVFKEHGIVVLGISKDSEKSHQNFILKQSLPFDLLSDPQHEVIEAYGAWQEKRLYGKVSMGIVRSTYVIDEDGMIERVYPKVKPDQHAVQILNDLGIQVNG